MKNNKSNKYIIISIVIVFLLAIVPNIVLAATSNQLNFCAYSGVRRTFKILGFCLIVIKTVVPLIVIGTAMISVFKTVTSGKADDLKASFVLITKKIIAGLIIFLLPTMIDFAFDTLIGYDDSGFTACTTCLLDVGNCTIPDTDPDTYVE